MATTLDDLIVLVKALQDFRGDAAYRSLRDKSAVALCEAFQVVYNGKDLDVPIGIRDAWMAYSSRCQERVYHDDEMPEIATLREKAADRLALALLALADKKPIDEPAEIEGPPSPPPPRPALDGTEFASSVCSAATLGDAGSGRLT